MSVRPAGPLLMEWLLLSVDGLTLMFTVSLYASVFTAQALAPELNPHFY